MQKAEIAVLVTLLLTATVSSLAPNGDGAKLSAAGLHDAAGIANGVLPPNTPQAGATGASTGVPGADGASQDAGAPAAVAEESTVPVPDASKHINLQAAGSVANARPGQPEGDVHKDAAQAAPEEVNAAAPVYTAAGAEAGRTLGDLGPDQPTAASAVGHRDHVKPTLHSSGWGDTLHSGDTTLGGMSSVDGTARSMDTQPADPVLVVHPAPDRPKRSLLSIPTPEEFDKVLPPLDLTVVPDVGGTPNAPPTTVEDLGLEVVLDDDDADEERLINLAAASDGASIVAANKEVRKPERLIDGDHDSYMKNACSANKWVIVELTQLGRVDRLVLTMKELYSSRVKDFSVKGRQSHPKKDGLADLTRGFELDSWQLLGNFTAQNKKGSQEFRMPRRARVRYLLLQFHTQYGSEEVCALNSVEVMGVTAAQELEAALSRPLPMTGMAAAPPAAAQQPSQPPPAAAATAAGVGATGTAGAAPPPAGVRAPSPPPSPHTTLPPPRPPLTVPPPQAPMPPPSVAKQEGTHAETVAAPSATQPSPSPGSGAGGAAEATAAAHSDAHPAQGAHTDDGGGVTAGSSISTPPPPASGGSPGQGVPQEAASPQGPGAAAPAAGMPTGQPAAGSTAGEVSKTGSSSSMESSAGASGSSATSGGGDSKIGSTQAGQGDGNGIRDDSEAGSAAGMAGSQHGQPQAGQGQPGTLQADGSNVRMQQTSSSGSGVSRTLGEVVGAAAAAGSNGDAAGEVHYHHTMEGHTSPAAGSLLQHPSPSCSGAQEHSTAHGQAPPLSPSASRQPLDGTSSSSGDDIDLDAPVHEASAAPPGAIPLPPTRLIPARNSSNSAIANPASAGPHCDTPASATSAGSNPGGQCSGGAASMPAAMPGPAGTALPHTESTAAATAAGTGAAGTAASGSNGVPQQQHEPSQVAASASGDVGAAGGSQGDAPGTPPPATMPLQPEPHPHIPPATPRPMVHMPVPPHAATTHINPLDGDCPPGSIAVAGSSTVPPAVVCTPALTGTGASAAAATAAPASSSPLSSSSSSPYYKPVADLWPTLGGMNGADGPALLMEGSAAAKPRVAGNLFDVIKQEMMGLKLNQSRLYKYMSHLVEALNAKNAELEASREELEARMAALTSTVSALPPAVDERVARALESSPLDTRMADLEARLMAMERQRAASSALCVAVMLYGAAALCVAGLAAVLPAGGGGGSSCGGSGWRALRRVALVLVVVNAAVAVWLTLAALTGPPPLQQQPLSLLGARGFFGMGVGAQSTNSRGPDLHPRAGVGSGGSSGSGAGEGGLGETLLLHLLRQASQLLQQGTHKH